MRASGMVSCVLVPLTLAACAPVERRGDRRSILSTIGKDYGNFYSRTGVRNLAIGFAVAAPMANTKADSDIEEWYIERVHSEKTDGASRIAELPGVGTVTIPACLLGCAAGRIGASSTLGEWGERSLRAYAVGGPFTTASQYLTGGGRPRQGDSSRWRPLHDNAGVSGHAFMGAVPFLTAAKMTDSLPVKTTFYLGSTACAWARVDRRDHYISQAFLGWWLALMAANSIDKTDADWQKMQVVPMVDDDFAGVGIHLMF